VLKVFILVFVGTIAVSIFLMNVVHTSEDADPSVNPNLRSEAYFQEMAEKNFPHASEVCNVPWMIQAKTPPPSSPLNCAALPCKFPQGWDDPALQEEAGAEAGLEAEAGFDPEEMAEFERQEGHQEGGAADVGGREVYTHAAR
jgi:hypothetical protein